MPHKRLSNAFTAIDLDLQQRVDSLSGGGLEDGALLEILWESDRTLKVQATCSGRWNAVVFWFKVGHRPAWHSGPRLLLLFWPRLKLRNVCPLEPMSVKNMP